MKTRFHFPLILTGILLSATTERVLAQTPVSGTVTSVSEEPLGYVNVILLGTTSGAMTDETGSFSFLTRETGVGQIQISLVGYQRKVVTVKLGTGKPVKVRVVLEEQDIALSELVVTGSSYSTESVSGLPVSPMEIVTTPGGAADIFQMLKTLPGLTPVSESADLYIRGGDPMESTVLVDQSAIFHPTTFESAYGGLFSLLPPTMVKNLWFSSGGFPAKYGNALSGVLDIETRNEPSDFRINTGWNVAGWDIQTTLPLVREKAGLNLYFKKSETGLLMKLNQNTRPFTSYPSGWTSGGTFSYSYSETGRMKATVLASSDQQGVHVDRPEGSSQFEGQSGNQHVGLSVSDVWNRQLIIKSNISVTQFLRNWKLGVLDLDEKDRSLQTRTDLEWIGKNGQKWYTGGEFRLRKDEFIGKVPASQNDYRLGAAYQTIHPVQSITSGGGYVEWEQAGWFGIPALATRAGVRLDHSSDRRSPTADPRLTISGLLSKQWTASLNWGIFHQSAWIPISDRPLITTPLPAMSAIHTVGSVTWEGSDDRTCRLEIWNKTYHDLPLKSGASYTSEGTGYARGLDVVYKGTIGMEIEGWISYGWAVSERKWLDYTQQAPSPADITHNLTWVAKKYLNPYWQIGWNLKLATGKPYTPVSAGIQDSTSGLFSPVYGETHSERLPFYHRLDFRITYTNTFFDHLFLVGYAELLNCLDTSNPMGYSWNSDYTRKTPIQSFFGNRTVVIGASVSF